MYAHPSRTRTLVGSRRRRADRAHPELGATAVEYALMVAFIAIVIVASVMVLGGRLTSIFSTAATSF